MKKNTALVLLLMFFVSAAIAQVPQSIPYQAVARSSSGNLLSNKNISLRFSIRNSSALGTIVYRETQAATTNSLGLFTSNIGQGAVVTGTFSGIDWASGTKFLQVELDTAGGSSYVDMGTQQMLSVPYAFYSGGSADWIRSGANLYNSNSGNTGIGTSTPTAKLDVVGKIRMADGTQGAGKVLGSDANGLASWVTPSSGTVTSVTATSPLNSSGGANPNISLGTAGVANGGTGIISYAAGDLLYASGGLTLAKLGMAASGNALLSGAGAPSWGKIGLSTHVSGILPIANGGTGTAASPLGGQLLIGNGSGYTLSNLTAGTGISITNGAGSITISNTSALSGGATNYLAKWTSGTTLAPSSVIYDDGVNVGLGINLPADKLHVIGSIRMVDGNQGVNKVMVSDANGKAAWTALSASLANAWGTTGNAGTSPATNYIGTSDAQPLMFRVSNIKAGQIGTMTGSTGFGYSTLAALTTGSLNVALGEYTLNSLTTGSYNSAIGNSALKLTVSGSNNIAIGNNALFNNVGGSGGIAIGSGAMMFANNSSTFFNNMNVAIGFEALMGNSSPALNTGNNNTAVGGMAMNVNSDGEGNSAFGTYALLDNTSGGSNTGIGYSALQNNTSGWYNTSIGTVSMISNTTGNANTALGNAALYYNVAGNRGTAVGGNAMLYANNSASSFVNENVAVGYEALRGSFSAAANTGNQNTAIGYQSLINNTTGSFNTSLGRLTMFNNNTGSDNTAVGMQAMNANTSGGRNTALGDVALYFNVTGNRATAVGYAAMYYSNNTATSFTNTNVAVGYEALRGSVTPSANTGLGGVAVGYMSLRSNSSGSENVAIGNLALLNNTTGQSNTAVGSNAHWQNVSGSYNTIIGAQASGVFPAGDFTTCIGYGAGPNTSGLTNATAIGANAVVSASNALVLGSNANVGIGCSAPQYKLHVAGDIASSATVRTTNALVTGLISSCSDIRYKKDVHVLDNSLDKLIKLQGVNYYWKREEFPERNFSGEKQIGLIAQEVEKVFPELVMTDTDGYKSVDYSKLTPVLIEAVKELKRENDELKMQFEKEIAQIKAQMAVGLKAEK